MELNSKIDLSNHECDMCSKNFVYEPRPLTLEGEDDFYQLEVCDDCYDKYSGDYYSPVDIECILGHR